MIDFNCSSLLFTSFVSCNTYTFMFHFYCIAGPLPLYALYFVLFHPCYCMISCLALFLYRSLFYIFFSLPTPICFAFFSFTYFILSPFRNSIYKTRNRSTRSSISGWGWWPKSCPWLLELICHEKIMKFRHLFFKLKSNGCL